MAAVEMRKTKVELNKPRYVGMTILNLSKIVMYNFHYKFILPKYPGATLLFTDTDSFCYNIPTEQNIYDEVKGNDWIDFSNYSRDHPNYSNKFKLIPGKFKDETAGIPIKEFVGLRAKMYSILKIDGDTKSTCKGIPQTIKNKVIKHQDYKDSLMENKVRSDKLTRIIQENHQLYTVTQNKVSLSPFNDKKWITKEDGVLKSLSYGHYSISDIEREEQELVNLLDDLLNSA